VKYLKGIKGCSSDKVTQLIAQMKCLCTKAQSMDNKQELEVTVLLESYDLAALTKTWWDEFHDRSVAINGYMLFKRDRQERSYIGIALYPSTSRNQYSVKSCP